MKIHVGFVKKYVVNDRGIFIVWVFKCVGCWVDTKATFVNEISEDPLSVGLDFGLNVTIPF